MTMHAVAAGLRQTTPRAIPTVGILNLAEHCRARNISGSFARIVKENIIARTFAAVNAIETESALWDKRNMTPERLSSTKRLAALCQEEFGKALALHDVQEDGTNLQLFLDDLLGMSNRHDVLAMLLPLSTAEQDPSDPRMRDGGSVSEQWLRHFLGTRMKWHMMQEDFLRLCDGVPPVVDDRCDAIQLVEEAAVSINEMCNAEFGLCPHVHIEAQCNELVFCGVPDQIRYIIAELLKNASVATVQSGNIKHPVRVVIGPTHGGSSKAADTVSCSTSAVTNLPRVDGFSIQITDGAGGVPPNALQNMWRLGWSGQNTQRRIAGFGVGLPLACIYAGLFGGSVHAAPVTAADCRGTTFTLEHPLVGVEVQL